MVGESRLTTLRRKCRILHLFDHVNEIRMMATIPEVPGPRHEYESVRVLFQLTLEHERFGTSKINDLVDAKLAEKDFSTYKFLQWYVAEQHEEAALFMKILDLVDLVGHEGRGQYHLDMEIVAIGQPSVVASPGGQTA